MDGNDCVIQVFNFISKRQHTALQISSNYIAFGDVTNTNIMLMWCQKWSVSYIPLMFFTKAATLPSKTTERTFSIYPSFSDEPIVDCVYCAKIDWARVKMMNIPHVDIIPKNIILHHNEFKDRKKNEWQIWTFSFSYSFLSGRSAQKLRLTLNLYRPTVKAFKIHFGHYY